MRAINQGSDQYRVFAEGGSYTVQWHPIIMLIKVSSTAETIEP